MKKAYLFDEKRMNLKKRRLVEELYAPVRRNFSRRRVIVRGYDDLWQADVIEMRPYVRRNKSYNYVLTVIDVLSKYAWALPLKSKSGSEIASALSKIFCKDVRCPRNLQTDKGKEFYNTIVQEIMKKRNINHYLTYSVIKASIVKRFNHTLKNMWKFFTLNGSYRWIGALPSLLSNYNNRKHRTIGRCDARSYREAPIWNLQSHKNSRSSEI